MAVLDAMIGWLAGFNRGVGHVVKWITLTLLAVMTAMVIAHVILRFGPGSPSWTEEMSIYMMIWIAFLVAPVAFRSGANVAIDVLKAAIGLRLRALLEIAFALSAIWILVLLLAESSPWIERNMGQSANTVAVPVGLFYLSLPIGLGLTLVSAVEVGLRALRVLLDPAVADHAHFHDASAAPEAEETGVAVQSLRD